MGKSGIMLILEPGRKNREKLQFVSDFYRDRQKTATGDKMRRNIFVQFLQNWFLYDFSVPGNTLQ